jgi:hypothetical protein
MNRSIRTLVICSLLLIFAIGVVNAESTPGMAFPELYPTVSSTTRLIVLDDSAISQAERDILNLEKIRDAENYLRRYEESWISAPGYYLGYQIPGFGSGKTPVSFGLITPYSAARYVYYKANSNYSLVNPAFIDDIKQYKNVAYVTVYSLERTKDDAAYNGVVRFKDVSIKKGNTIYPSLPKEKFLPRVVTSMAYEYMLWPFPIDIFANDGEPLEIQATDELGGKRKWTIPQKQFNLLK